jgi:CCDC81-like prokaryotic HU domain 2
MHMRNLITSFLLQSKQCALPHLGIFQIKMIPSKPDMANKQILPPYNEISFQENRHTDPGNLPNYIADKKNILIQEAKDELDIYCRAWKKKMNAGEKLYLDPVGWLQKNSDGHIYFEKTGNNSYWQPVSAERVLRQNATHNVLVGDRETTSTAMNQYYNGEVVFERSHWSTWAIILTAIASSVLFFHFSNHSIATEGVGNQQHFVISDPPGTLLK